MMQNFLKPFPSKLNVRSMAERGVEVGGEGGGREGVPGVFVHIFHHSILENKMHSKTQWHVGHGEATPQQE